MPEIRIENLTKTYGERTVLAGLSLNLTRPGVVALCGPSGSGKSTLLSLIAGLEKPDGGRITVRGTLAMSFQDPALLPWRTAAENVALVLGDKKSDLPAAARLLDELGLDEHSRGQLPAALSGGMRARVGIARALARRAGVLLLDEPFAALDRATADRTAAVIRAHAAGALVVAVVHDPSLAAAFADTVVTLDGPPLSVVRVTERADGSSEVLAHPLEGPFFDA